MTSLETERLMHRHVHRSCRQSRYRHSKRRDISTQTLTGCSERVSHETRTRRPATVRKKVITGEWMALKDAA